METYRDWILQAEQKAQDDFDKTVITLSGGAIGVSFTYVKDLLGGKFHASGFLVAAWLAWTLSVAVVLLSFYVSRLALDKTMEQVDDGTIDDVMKRGDRPGGRYAKIIAWLNPIGGLLFLAGLICMTIFMAYNV